MCRSLSHIVVDVNTPGDLVAVAEALSQFGVSKRTVERLIAEHQIPKYKRPGDKKLYVSHSEVARHLGFHEVRAKYD